MKRAFALLTISLAAMACTNPAGPAGPGQEAEGDWIANSVVYELNTRQATAEGTFAAAEKELPRLKELGVDVVWLMPIHPIGVEGRKGSLGSYYAIRDYCAINPESGTLEDFDHFVEVAHDLGLRVVIDWVANHTSPDHPWVSGKAADWYVRDAEGKTIVEYDWTDIAKLNYDNQDMRAEMEKSMRFWLDRGIDGFRCDVAYQVPRDFWSGVIARARADYSRRLYFLAEGEEPWLHEAGFDATYAWKMHHLLNDIARGKTNADSLVRHLLWNQEEYGSDACRLAFTSNHDENSWNGTEYERMGDAWKVMSVLCWTLPNTQPLIYTGQEVGYNHRFRFFEKDPMPDWNHNAATDFYENLATIKHAHKALSSNNAGFELVSKVDSNFVFRRFLDEDTVTVAVSLKAPWTWNITASESRVSRVEPPCWWTGMKTDLQLMIHGEDISGWNVSIEGRGLKVTKVRKAESPDYLFVDVEVGRTAEPGTYDLVFSDGSKSFRKPYRILAREAGSADRQSFTTSDFIYLICPDRFANADPGNDDTDDTAEKADRSEPFGRHGGDLQGIIDHLDYVAGLGATAIWCTPLLLDNQDRESYHGYACGDYYRIDPRFGSNEQYKEYVSRAHEKGLKVIMDVVTNHCGTTHWWMRDLPFRDWIHQFPEYTGSNFTFSTLMDPNASAYDRAQMESGWFVPSMPDMNLDNPFLLKYFQQWAIWWIEYSGLDGLRVDTYPYNEKGPMSEWCKAVLDEYPNLNIVGECWDSQFDQLAYWQGGHPNADGFDSHLPSIMDFPLQEAIMAAMGENQPQWGQGMFRVYNALAHDATYADVSKMLVFLSNHDHYRIADAWHQDPDKMKLAYTLLATVRGIPQLFYGDEMMFATGKDYKSDGELRMDFPGGWAGDAVNLFTDEGRKAASGEYADAAQLHDLVRKLFQWRKGCEAVQNGRTMHFLSRDNTYAYFRYFGSASAASVPTGSAGSSDPAGRSGKKTESAVPGASAGSVQRIFPDLSRGMVFVYVNNSPEDKTVPWVNYAEIASGLAEGTDVLTGERVDVRQPLVVPASSALVLEFGAGEGDQS